MYLELNDGESVTIAMNHDKHHKINRHCFTIIRRGNNLMCREFGALNKKLNEEEK